MTVTTRRERRQQQRRQQQRRSASTGGGGSRGVNQLWIALGIVVVVVALVLVGRAAGVFEAPAPQSKTDVNAVDVSGPTVGEHHDELSRAHITTGQKGNYSQGVPPTSGEHWNQVGVAPVPWGTKTAWLPFEATTHNLEHGGIVIMYNGLTPQQIQDVQALVRSLNSSGLNKIILEPWPDMPKDSKIILTAWNWILRLPNPDDTTFVRFVRQHYESNEAPEPGTP